MEMAIPEGFTNNIRENELKSTNDVLDEATNILIKEFQTFLAKDIRERIIAPNILDLLAHDKYPELVEELKSREQAAKPKVLVTNNQLKENALSILEKQRQLFQQRLPSFRMSHDRTQQHKPKEETVLSPCNMPLILMMMKIPSHTLNQNLMMKMKMKLLQVDLSLLWY